jgi:hypothetical protein
MNLPAAFVFQTTDPATNQITGTPNTLVNIPAGAAQSFVFAFTPTASIATTDVPLSFACANSAPAPTTSGLNTLLLSASAAPVPDIVTLAATLNKDGIVTIPGAAGTGVFAVATANVGAGGIMTATADTGGVLLPASVALCETNPTTRICIATPRDTVTIQIAANATPTFGIFVTGRGAVPFDPATSRIFIHFKDPGGMTRGATSVAVVTSSVCELAMASPAALWPPNHDLVPVEILGVTDLDTDRLTLTVTGVRQDEPVNGLGDGYTSPDAVLQGAGVLLRAEHGNGRIYEIFFRADDSIGERCTGSVTVSVPHDQGDASCVDDGLQFDATQP